jgi:outer membrane protein assembly factor BamB
MVVKQFFYRITRSIKISTLVVLIIFTLFCSKSKNTPPYKPAMPAGPTLGRIDSTYEYFSFATDPDGDSLSIRFNWGDDSVSDWSANVLSGDTVKMSRSYSSPGTFYIRAQAQDIYGAISEWSDWLKIDILGKTGTLRWSYATSGLIHSSPAINFNGTIYIGSGEGKLYAINPDGTLKWAYITGGGIFSSPAIGSDGTIYFGSLDKKVYALNPNGTLRWTFTTDGLLRSSPVIGYDGTIYIGLADYHKFYAINPNGTEKWVFSTGGGIISTPAISADGIIYFGSDDNKLYALNLDGTLKWTFTTNDDIRSSPVIGSEGTIYIGSNDGKLYAVYGSGALATTHWPMFQHDIKHTGCGR